VLNEGSLQLLESVLDAANALNHILVDKVLLLERTIELSVPWHL
jgi:hypothetical protein